jgi:hypothetical protein
MLDSYTSGSSEVPPDSNNVKQAPISLRYTFNRLEPRPTTWPSRR